MILVDYSGLALVEVFGYFYENKNETDFDKNKNLLKHLILNRFLELNKKFKYDYGNIVICMDSTKPYWRKEYFPYYKCKRKERKSDVVDFQKCYKFMNDFGDELKQNTHYKVLMVDGAESDDLIAVLVEKFIDKENMCIVSRDDDYRQLQRLNSNLAGNRVVQWDFLKEKFIESEDPEEELIEKIIKGDSGDSVPNVLSDDKVFYEHRRQVVMSKKRYELIRNFDESFINDEIKSNIKRNSILIDFRKIPNGLKQKIIEANETTKTSTKMNLMNFLIENKMNALLRCIEEF